MLRTLRSIGEAVLFGPNGAPPTERLDWLVAEAADFLAHAGARTRFLMRLLVFAVAILAPLGVGRLRSLPRLPLRQRVHALSRLEQSALGAPLFAVKAFLSLLYYEHPDAQREVGFDARCLVSRGGTSS